MKSLAEYRPDRTAACNWPASREGLVEPITLILAALTAGAARGAGETASKAVMDAYVTLRDALRRRLAGKPAALDAVDNFAEDPEEWRGNLEIHLRKAGAGTDPAVMTAAAEVMQHVDPVGTGGGKYLVDLRGSSGVQVGDKNVQRNYWGSTPR
jgi:hypothetical protein